MINEQVCVESAKLRLVPYLPHHVHRYHEWMCEPELLAATESEPLSLEEEQENQQSWLLSLDKLTFIILASVATVRTRAEAVDSDMIGTEAQRVVPRSLTSTEGTVQHVTSVHPTAYRCTPAALRALKAATQSSLALDDDADQLWLTTEPTCVAPSATTPEPRLTAAEVMPLPVAFIPGTARDLLTGHRVPAALPPTTPGAPTSPHGSDHLDTTFVMVGDCNLFLLDPDELPGETEPTSEEVASNAPCRCFEVEVMIADQGFRRRGLAEEAVRQIMQYAVSILGATCFVAKILDDNVGSIRLFQDKLHFSVYKEVKVFHEVHMVRYLDTEEKRQAWAREWAANAPQTNLSHRCCCRPYNADLEASMLVLSHLV